MSGLFSLESWSTVWTHRESFLLGLGNTLQTAVCALALAFIIGAALGLMSTSGSKLLRIIARIYVEFVQNTPLLLQLCFLYYALAQKNYLCHSLHIPPQAFIIRYTALFSNVDSGYFSRISTLFSITFQQNGVVMVYQTVLYQPDIFRSCRSDDPGKSTSFAICSAAWS